MKIYNLLILSSSNHVQLVNSFKNAYEQLNLKGNVFTADLNERCASRIASKKHFIIPRSDSEAYLPTLERLIKEKDLNIILSARDEEIEFLSKNKAFFDKFGCFLLISDEKSVGLCRDKYKLAQFFSKNDIPYPKTFLYEELRDQNDLKYPIICKPRFGKGGIGIFLAKTIVSIENQIDNFDEYMFQEYIKGTEYTIDVLSDFESKVLSVIPRKRVSIKGGESIVSITEKNDQLIDLGKKISEEIGFIGHINIQCILKQNIPYFIEINPRFGGASNLAFEAGMKSPFNIMRLIKGEKIDPFIGDFKENLTMLRYTQDFFI